MGLGTGRNRRRSDPRDRVEHVRSVLHHRGAAAARALTVILVLVVSAAGGSWTWVWARTSPRFSVQRITFNGLKRASEVDLLRLTGLSSGQNLFSLDTGAAERAMGQHPWVKSVVVRRQLPSALSVVVEEHVPAAMLALGELYLVNEDGKAFRRVQAGDALDLPLLTGISREAYEANEAAEGARIARALGVARVYAETHPGRRVRLSEVRLERGDEVTLVAGEGGTEVRLGAGDVEAKLERLAKVRQELDARGLRAEVIHLDDRARPERVAIKLSGSVSERNGTR